MPRVLRSPSPGSFSAVLPLSEREIIAKAPVGGRVPLGLNPDLGAARKGFTPSRNPLDRAHLLFRMPIQKIHV